MLEAEHFVFAHLLAERHLELVHFEMLRMAPALAHADVFMSGASSVGDDATGDFK